MQPPPTGLAMGTLQSHIARLANSHNFCGGGMIPFCSFLCQGEGQAQKGCLHKPYSPATSVAGPVSIVHRLHRSLRRGLCAVMVVLLQPDGPLPPPDAKPTYHDVTATIAEVRRIILPSSA
jgi:hypothetical protein